MSSRQQRCGEMAAEWTMEALREIRDAIRGPNAKAFLAPNTNVTGLAPGKRRLVKNEPIPAQVRWNDGLGLTHPRLRRQGMEGRATGGGKCLRRYGTRNRLPVETTRRERRNAYRDGLSEPAPHDRRGRQTRGKMAQRQSNAPAPNSRPNRKRGKGDRRPQTKSGRCATAGAGEKPAWEDAPDWQKNSAVNGVEYHVAHPRPVRNTATNVGSETRRAGSGGPEKSVNEKEHPCMVPLMNRRRNSRPRISFSGRWFMLYPEAQRHR